MTVTLRPLAPAAPHVRPPVPAPAHAGSTTTVDSFSAPVPPAGLKRGSHGAAVKLLQSDLVKLKYLSAHDAATGPGTFGPHTEAAVKAFQHHAHLPATGVYDSRTRNALALALQPHHTVKHPTQVSHGLPAGTGAQYAYFQKRVGKHFKTGPNQMNLIGYRHPTSTYANGGRGVYDDKLYMVWKDASGHPHVQRFTYNADPAQVFVGTAKDVNGDGRGDLGRIPAGFHSFALSTRAGTGAHCLRTAQGDFKVERDVNHDGRFDEHRLSSGGSNFLFHEGGSTGTWSQGCQTLAPSQWQKFWSAVKHAHGTIGYTLINGVPAGF